METAMKLSRLSKHASIKKREDYSMANIRSQMILSSMIKSMSA
jgi:hypothetical protein